VEHNNVTVAVNHKTGIEDFFIGRNKLSVEDGVALSTGKDKPLDRSGCGVFRGCDFNKEKENG